MRSAVFVCVITLLVAGSVRNASAQVGSAWTDKGYASFNIGFQPSSGDLNGSSQSRIYGETATFSVAQDIGSGVLFDLAGGARVWRNVSVGLGYHQEGDKSSATVDASVPHPLFFNRPRTATATLDDLKRTERAVHLQFGYMLPITPQLSAHLLLGPSFFSLRQDTVTSVTPVEQGGNFSTVGLNTTAEKQSESATGFNIGVDFTYMVTTGGAARGGVGMFLRYAAASADVTVLDQSASSDMGGFQVGFGGRVRF